MGAKKRVHINWIIDQNGRVLTDDEVDKVFDRIEDDIKEAAQIPVVVSVRGKLTCSQCGEDGVRVAALFRTEDCRRVLCVCAVCLKATSEAASEAGK